MFTTFIIMKFNGHIVKRSFFVVSSLRLDYRDLLSKNLPIAKKDIDSIVSIQGDKLLDIPPDKVIHNCKILRKLNVQLNSITNILPCLTLQSSTLKHRIFLLQEMGVHTVDINLICRFLVNMNMSASDFKRKSKIPKEQNIMINLHRYIDNKMSDPPPLELLNESLPVSMHFQQCFSYYVKHELGTSNMKLSTRRGRKYKSIRLMTKILNIFREEIGVDQAYLRNHLSILDMCPDDVAYMIESLKDVKIGTMTIQEAIKKKPGISQYDPQNIKELLRSFKMYGWSDPAVNCCLQGLKIKNEDFVKKMKHLLTIPDIRVWCKNPRILHFINNEKVISERMDYLRRTGSIKWTNVYLLTSSKGYFKRYTQDDFNCTIKRTYVKYILFKELGSDKEHILDLLTRHQYWNRVSFVDIDSTLRYLKQHFQIEDICPNIHLILYPWKSIAITLKSLREMSTCKQDYHLTSSQLLAFCLYLLEKRNHFTGDGVWTIEGARNKRSLKKEKLILEDISNKSDETLELLSNTKLHAINEEYAHKM